MKRAGGGGARTGGGGVAPGARSTWPLASVMSRMPPPTVRGTSLLLAATSTWSIGRSVSGQSRKPVMLRNVTSSAPSS